ncbi:MAG: proline iminopeptidase-family hydrolase [Bacteroidota bacterium]
MKLNALALLTCFFFACSTPQTKEKVEITEKENTVLEENDKGIREIPIKTDRGTFKVWTKQVGANPDKRVLLLHGGPGGTHEFFTCFENYFPEENIEYILYDQLGSFHSDQPSDTALWTNYRFVEEVEQVRQALGLDSTNFYLYGQSWGGILGMEYALKYQEHLKGLIISNMVSDIDGYCKYAKEELGPKLPPEVFEEVMKLEEAGDFGERYANLLNEHYYTRHILRKPLDQWPEEAMNAFNNLNPEVYIYMQGHSEFGITEGATLEGWSVSNRLKEIYRPTLCIGATYDTMDPKHMEWMSTEVQKGRFLLCENGSHLSQYDDPEHFFPGLISFINDVDAGELD